MKSIILSSLLLLLVSNTCFASKIRLATCHTVIPSLEEGGKSTDVSVKVYHTGNSLEAKVDKPGIPTKKFISETEEYPVRKDFLKSLVMNDNVLSLSFVEADDWNYAERLLAHAYALMNSPVFAIFENFSTGVDLSKVRSVRLYYLDKATKFGRAAIVKTRDENGSVLGSFLSGFFVTPCDANPLK